MGKELFTPYGGGSVEVLVSIKFVQLSKVKNRSKFVQLSKIKITVNIACL